MANNEIINIFKEYYNKHKCPSRIKEYIKNNYNDIYLYLVKNYFWCKTFNEIYLCLIYNINKEPKCPVCNKSLKFVNKPNKPYNTFCSKKCYLSNKGKTIIQEKIKLTCLNNYGYEYSFQSYNNKEKSKLTSINNWGVTHPMKSNIIKDKLKESIYNKYNCFYIGQVADIKDKIANTNIKKHGVKTVLMLDNIKDKAHNKESIEKSFNTYKKNHPDGKSNIEKSTSDFLSNTFGKHNVISQYKSDVYPFHCDFYIVSLDTYIEIQGHQSHGSHPYNDTNINDINKVKIWKSKCNYDKPNQYNKFIEVWTKRDVKKRQSAIYNKLNYIEIFSIDIDYVKHCINDYINNIKYGYKSYYKY